MVPTDILGRIFKDRKPPGFRIMLLLANLLTVAPATAAEDIPSSTELNGIAVTFPQESRFIGISGSFDKVNTWFIVRNTNKEPKEVSLEFKLQRDLLELGEPRSLQLKLLPESQTKVAVPTDLLSGFGLYNVWFRLVTDSGSSSWAQDVLAVYRQNEQPSRGESVMPIGFATGAPRATPRLLELAASLGFEYYRFNAIWSEIQPLNSEWDWEWLDSYLKLIKSHGFRWHVTTTGSAAWAASKRSDLPDLKAWDVYIGTLAKRYESEIEFWEVWNEPNLHGFFSGTVEDYTNLQRVAYDAIKAVNRDIMVTSGGYAGMNHGQSKPGSFEAAFREYPRAYDWFAYHMHDTFPQFYSDVDRQLAAIAHREGRSNVPIVFTETGYDTRRGQRFQAETLVKKITYAASIGAKSYTWYNLIDRSGQDAPEKPGFTFGLISNPTGTSDFESIENDLRPKESFIAASVAIGQLRSRPPLDRWVFEDRDFTFLFGGQGNYLLVSWHEDPLRAGGVHAFHTNSASVEKMDLFGNSSPVPVEEGLVPVEYGSPAYYLFDGSTRAPHPDAPLVTAPSRIVPGKNGETLIELIVRNPLSRPVSITPEILHLPSGVNLAVEPESKTLQPGENRDLSLHFLVAPGGFGEVRSVEIGLKFNKTSWNPRLVLPIVFDTIDAAKGQILTLESFHNVTNKHDYDPNSLHLLWGSPVDLSVRGAAFFISDRGKILNLKIEVADNFHFPAPSGAPLLEGDALELGWTTPSGTEARIEIAGDIGDNPRTETNINAIEKITISRSLSTTTYDVRLDIKKMGVQEVDMANGIRFNFALHDNDGEGSKSWISPSPGLGGSRFFAPDVFPTLNLR